MSAADSSGAPPALVREAAPDELVAASEIVRAAGLPLDGLALAAVLLVAEADGAIVGTVALERHGTGAATAYLLRSAAVTAAWRGRGIGAQLTAAALQRVDAVAAPVALLTETAEGYFRRYGFQPVDRAGLPRALDASAELGGACPASARAMMRPPTPR